ncbi:MAG: hypothetical protein MOGMAGMI_02382 [Candidatus Omnitrophica bacterium]|nr:hypothetical protein [Candidatus Omnitrophota bacterium]
MYRTCIVDLDAGVVVNVLEYEAIVTGAPPGLNSGLMAVPSDEAQIGWRYDGEKLRAPPVVTPLPELKAAKNAEINQARAAANTSTFPHDGKTFACDALSRSDIDGVNGYVALYGALPPDFPGAWKAADNSYYPIPDVAAWKAFYASMVAAGSANFAHAQTLKAQLAAATTAEAVAAIVW